MRRALSLVALAVAVGIVSGCGPSAAKRYGVSGTVKYKGQPVKSGSISFRADDGSTGGAPITDGRYDIPAAAGLTPGTYKVAISYPDPKAPQPKGNEMPGEAPDVKDLIPAEYNAQTKLTAEVKAEVNDVSFDLK